MQLLKGEYRKNRRSTIKKRIIIIMTAFTLAVATLLSYFSYELISYFQRKTTIQAAEFNLQLVAHIIEQDLQNLSSLAMLYSTNSSTNALLVDYFRASDASAMDAVNVFTSMQNVFWLNPSNAYARRLIVTNNEGEFFQLDNSVSQSSPLYAHNLHLIPELDAPADGKWQYVVQDPLSHAMGIPFILPIYAEANERVGTVYLLANVTVITDRLKGYSLASDSKLLLTLGNTFYQIEGEEITSLPPSFHEYPVAASNALDSRTQLFELKEEGKRAQLGVSYPVREGVSLAQTLPSKHYTPQVNIWVYLMIGVSTLVIAMSGVITVYLTRTISLPVEKLKKRMDKIAQGNFLVDRNIEWNNELGDVGRGINHMTQDILALMDSRVADEKRARILEYRMLQSQITPHFLYNTLNSIKWMATIQNATGIAEMTTSLSRLLRSMAKDMRILVPLGDELSLLDDYFLIQKYRYGSTITMDQQLASPDLLACLIPRFTLQPIVENAIFHGIEPKGGGHIAITIENQAIGGVLITVEDNGIGMQPDQVAKCLTYSTASSEKEAEDSQHIQSLGVRSVNERIKLTFGERYGLSIESEVGQYTRMRILLPQQSNL